MPKPPNPTVNTEVIADPANDRRLRRRFSREEKLRILAAAEQCAGRGELSALLRKEGIYSSHLHTWREQLRAQGEAGLEPRRPGPKPSVAERDLAAKNAKLEREKARLEHELKVTRALLELAGKAHAILGVALPSLEDDEKR